MINPGQLEEPNHFNNVDSIPYPFTSCGRSVGLMELFLRRCRPKRRIVDE
ncbi:MAG: hypothetical protein AVDCRST_MAG26-3616 [uncultured Chloroflexia bacterium]|uniref:Uncharacterized protein n=1 Tax=uncultured Chloroflexia bacterium TaxID=1672391 RepID=A0A6J4JQ01_9CHLR|nr:MAG: hypothetical protein AVDCRST_MAG26-3616 [uncultured Chloroflexia bacterium]